MPAQKRTYESAVIDLLLDEPQRFQFVQLVNLLLGVLRRHGVPYERAFKEVLRFQNSLSLAFPASEVHAVEVEPKAPLDKRDGVRAMQSGQVRKIRITPAFVGLLGATGTLPLHDTERLAARQSMDGDASQRELMDVFSNRLVGLFYEAWGKYRVEHGIDVRGQDRLLPMLMALAGVRTHAANGLASGRVRAETKAYYASLLRTRPVSAATVERVLADYFGVPIQLEQFVGSWDPIPENRRSTLGTTNPTLGAGTALGVRLWRHDLRVRLHVGPLEEAQLAEFLPGGAARRAMEEMVTLFATPTLRYEIRLLLAPSCVKRMTLSTRADRRRLGWDTFLTGTAGVTQCPEIGSMLRLRAGVPR
ncbi:type VI secretion system baseplate subunit TssG [Massilia solisilvae]|uniref:Type VI secretion system baseplate subunit TssG n=1 Tax=Massilia solisilvae TaxID=1811225 RepID=A0ABT2BJN7_9BURK|nr:type VI secretion system baseplate subunit TssG [Massilia solisilvae]MCS0608626.1 type VI secretion system baseplate subunit TssG [Massilia solisilvae]